MQNSSPILPIGKVNIKSGKSQHFNIYRTWPNEDTTVEFWQPNNYSTIRMIFTSGPNPIGKKDKIQLFISDQTRKKLFEGKLIDHCLLKDLPKKFKEYGNSILSYVYK